MNIIKFLPVCLLISASQMCQAGVVTILGMSECKDWMKEEVEQKKLSASYDMRLNYTMWSLGFLSGFNYANPSDRNLLEAVNSDLVKEWISAYCKAKPNASLSEALLALIKKIEGKK